MFSLKFKHVFIALMSLAFLTAFVVPSRFVTGHVPAVELLFARISRPSGAIARLLHGSFAPPELSDDKRAADVVKRENEALKSEIASLYLQVTELEKKEVGRMAVGDIRPLCDAFKVASTDSGVHASLGIQGSRFQGLKDQMVAIYGGGIVGRVQRAGIAGARVQLITDYGFTVKCGFVRMEGSRYVRLKPPQTVAAGTGHGAMHIDLIDRDDVKVYGLRLDDLVVLNDPEWAPYLQGRVLGKITKIGPLPNAPASYDQITVEPTQNLLRLTEVLIVTKVKEDEKNEN